MNDLCKWEKNGAKFGEGDKRKTVEKWDETPIFHDPIAPFFPEAAQLPTNSLYKTR